MRRFELLGALLITAVVVSAQNSAEEPKVVCDKLPYRLGHRVILNSTDLRLSPRAATKKELKELQKKEQRAQVECNAFVRQYPGRPVSRDMAYTVEGFAAYYERCESFCGTDKDLFDQINKDTEASLQKK